MYLFNVGKVRFSVPVYRKKIAFPIIKANGVTKSIMKKMLKQTNKILEQK